MPLGKPPMSIPDRGPEFAGVYDGCNRPVWPRHRLPFNPVDLRGELLECLLVSRPCRFRPGGQNARVSTTVVIAQSGHGTACRSTPSTFEVSFLNASW